MTTSGTKKALRHIGLYVIMGAAAFFHFTLTFVVVLFLLSTFNIVNQGLLHLGNTDNLEKALTALIFIFSAIFFLRSLKKITRFIKQVIFKDPTA